MKKRGRPRKCIWEHFTEITNDDARKEQRSGAQSLSCTELPPPEICAKYVSILHNNYEQDDDEQDNLLPNKKQSKITDHIEKSTITDEKQYRCSCALTKFFVCCDVSFWIVENPFFIDLVKSLYPGFQLFGRTSLLNNMVNKKCVNVIDDIKKDLENEKNLTLGIDSWTTPLGQSLYVFIIITSEKKEYVHSLRNFSKESHTVSDHAANIVLAKKLITDQYPHILSMRCIAHHINLLTNDIMKLDWTTKIITECKKIITFFKKSHTVGELLKEEIVKNLIKGGGLKQHVNKGLHDDTFRIICKKALSIWKKLGGEKESANILMLMCRQKNNYIQQLALMINSITPHNVSCKRIFSILGWYMNKRRSKLHYTLLEKMIRMHSYYVTNSRTEFFNDTKENDINDEDEKNFNKDEDFDDNYKDFNGNFDDEEITKDDEVAIQLNKNKVPFENLVNLNDLKFLQALEIEIFIPIPSYTEITETDEHGDSNYDIQTIVKDAMLKKGK
ncbi:hypothetical protein RhiirC2_788900 [Rhizophagus irregularis]|uniref:Uncharacterized protein n=1 Tax=Rhizophagus irregularis TaxID=588596 RepID=A0A2N1MPB6_9GLOM|nr:hypothetical protein RhiirC2_788900 [Rhizophagus irregularis]